MDEFVFVFQERGAAGEEGEDPSSEEEEDLDEEGHETGEIGDLKEFELCDLINKASVSSPSEEENGVKVFKFVFMTVTDFVE